MAETDTINRQHSERFRKVANRYPRRVWEAYAGDLDRAMADTDEQVAATVAAWERAEGVAVRDWVQVGVDEGREATAPAVFDQWALPVADAVRVIDELAQRWPASDTAWEALIGTLNHTARRLHIDGGRSRGRTRSPLTVPSSVELWRDQEARALQDERDNDDLPF